MGSVNKNLAVDLQSSYAHTLDVLKRIEKENKKVDLNINSWKLALKAGIGHSKGPNFIRRFIRPLADFDFSFLKNLIETTLQNEDIEIKDRVELAYELRKISDLKSKTSHRRPSQYAEVSGQLKTEIEKLERSLVAQYGKFLSDDPEYRDKYVFIDEPLNGHSLSLTDNEAYYGKIVISLVQGDTYYRASYLDPLSGERIDRELQHSFKRELKTYRDNLDKLLQETAKGEQSLGTGQSSRINTPGRIIIKKEPSSIKYTICKINEQGKEVKYDAHADIHGLITLVSYLKEHSAEIKFNDFNEEKLAELKRNLTQLALQTKEYYWNSVPAETVKKALNKQEVGAWLIRYDKDDKAFYICRSEGYDDIKVTRLDDKINLSSLESGSKANEYGLSRALPLNGNYF